MMSKVVCCDTCFERLAKRSTSAARIWLDLCRIRLEKGQVFELKCQDFAELHTLEIMGYVITTDYPSRIGIFVNGYCITDKDEEVFCLEGGEHDE